MSTVSVHCGIDLFNITCANRLVKILIVALRHQSDNQNYMFHSDVPSLVAPNSDGCTGITNGCTGFGCPKTCYCQDHCSWQKCTLLEPPEECLRDTNGSWQWESNYWVAEYNGV